MNIPVTHRLPISRLGAFVYDNPVRRAIMQSGREQLDSLIDELVKFIDPTLSES